MAISRFPITHLELIVEMVGDGPCHTVEAFGLLVLPVLDLDLLYY